MRLDKTQPVYQIVLTQTEAVRLSCDLHRWYTCASVDRGHIECIEDELAEGECEFGLTFMIELQKEIDDRT